MEYQVQFGTLNAKRRVDPTGKQFRIAVLGDFSAKGNSGKVEIGEALAARKPLKVTHENLSDLLERLDVHLHLPAGAGENLIDVPIRSLEDFHPDSLYRNVPLFEKLMSLRQRLQDPSSFEKAAAAVRSLANVPVESAARRHSESSRVPRGRIESFSDLLSRDQKSPAEPAELKTLLRDVVGPHIVPEMQDQATLLAAVDSALSDLMRRLLHHPDFQALESLWRSLDFLVHRIELDHITEVVLYDVSAAELAADLATHENLEESGLYRWFVEHPSTDANHGPLSILCSNFVFELVPPHIELLARMSKIAASAGAPFLAAMDATCVQQKAAELHPLVKAAWEALRGLPESAYVALTSPRFMLRWPYGKKTERIDSFQFEEFTAKSGLSGMLWGNASILATVCTTLNFQQSSLKEMDLGAILSLNDMPFYYYTDQDGDQIALPCTERLVNTRSAEQLNALGIVPVLSMRGRDEVRLGGMKGVRGVPLAGPWAPADLSGATAELPTIASAAEAAAASPAAAPTTVPADDDLDNLLASLGDESASTSDTSTPDASADDDLDSLLASLDSADDAKASQASEVDDELAALLADL